MYVRLFHLENGVIEYQISRNDTGEVVLKNFEETTAAQHLTVERWLPLKDLSPGSYTLQLNVTGPGGPSTPPPGSP
jgi:hypothetical protein